MENLEKVMDNLNEVQKAIRTNNLKSEFDKSFTLEVINQAIQTIRELQNQNKILDPDIEISHFEMVDYKELYLSEVEKNKELKERIKELQDKNDELEEENSRLGNTVDELNKHLTDAFEKIRELQEDCNRYHEWGMHEGYEEGYAKGGSDMEKAKQIIIDKLQEQNKCLLEDNAELHDEIQSLNVFHQEALEKIPKWHLVADGDYPKAEEPVLLVAKHIGYKGKVYYNTFRGIYEDGTIHSDDSMWNWDSDYTDALEYCEETDDYIIGKGWYEETLFNPDNMSYKVDENDEVIAWMELPKFESEE